MRALLIVLLTACALNAHASHLAGADLYVDYIGAGPADLKYKMTLVVYTVCEPNAANLYTTEIINISSPSNTGLIMSRQVAAVGAPDTLNLFCPSFAQLSSCYNPGSVYPGVERSFYIDTVTVPYPLPDLTFTWEDGARNGGIVNLVNPSSESFHVECMVNNVVRYDNSSPRFATRNIGIFSINQPALYATVPYDFDNDSLVIVNTNPLTLFGAPISYEAGYSLSNPLASTTGYVVDANTGNATFTPANTGKYAVAFRAFKYDRLTKQLLGYTTRESQLIISSSNAAPPTISKIAGNVMGAVLRSDSTVDGYVGQPMSFTIAATGSIPGSNIYLGSALSNTPGATFPVVGNGTISPSGTFSWVPPSTYNGDTLYVLFRAIDSTCTPSQPLILSGYSLIKVHVLTPNTGVGGAAKGMLSIYPNPANNELHITGLNRTASVATIMNATGAVIANAVITNGTLNVSMLPPGFYGISIGRNGGTYKAWFVKK